MKKILVVDDSVFMRNILKDLLSAKGYEITEAQNGNEALAKYGSDKPDLTLLDIIMPELDGIEVLKKIGATAKVVVISAVGQEKMVEKAKKLGAVDYIVKPFDNDAVIKTVEKALS